MNRPEISVIIPVYNASRTLGLQLDALAEQVGAPEFEVIVVDNGSTDDLGPVLADRRADRPWLRVIRATRRQGASYARNAGAAAARSARLMFCDADDVVSAYWLAHGRRNFESADMWSGAAIPVPDVEFGDDVSALRERIGDGPEWVEPVDDQQSAFPILMGGDFGVTAEVYRALRGFDQSLPSAGEDNDLAFRARRAGQRLPIATTTRIAYRTRTDTRLRRIAQYRAARAHALIASRYGAWSDSGFASPWRLLVGCALASVKMTFMPSSRDWNGLSERYAVAIGLASGSIEFRRFHRIPRAELGIGLDVGQHEEASR